jgi:hypothetical protein
VPGRGTVFLPQVKSWKISGGHDTLHIFDFSAAERLDFSWDESPHPFKLTLFPPNLSEMVLSFEVIPKDLPIPSPYSMPHITTIKFESMDIPSHLQRYFHLPKLKRLYLDNITCRLSFDIDETWEDDTEPDMLLDPLFFQSVPELEFLSLYRMSVDDRVFANLQLCPQFRQLKMDICQIDEEFLKSLLTILTDEGSLPSLEIVQIDTSWPHVSGFSFETFASRCRQCRPGIVISGDEKKYAPNAWF